MIRNQTLTLLLLAMVCLSPANAAEMRQYFTVYSENRTTDPVTDIGTTDAAGFGMEIHGNKQSNALFYGINIGKMTSDQIISSFGDRYIGYPVYMYFGLVWPIKIAPYIEYGFEVAEELIHEQVEGEKSYTDYYFAAGVAVRTKAVLLKFYVKEHKIKPYLYTPVELYVGGFSVGFEF